MSQPPRVGPNTGATTTPKPKAAMALPRFARGKLSRRMDWESGCNAPPPAPLRSPRDQDPCQAGRRAAQKRGRRKQDDTKYEKIAASKPQGKPAACRQNHGVGHEIAREDQVASSMDEDRLPAICGSATEAMEVSSTSMKVGRITETAINHALQSGRQSSRAPSLGLGGGMFARSIYACAS